MNYRIGDVAALFNLTKEGIRFLEKRGLIHSVRDERNGYRYYPREEITKLKQIRFWENLGFSLDEAQKLCSQTRREELVPALDAKLNELDRQIRNLTGIRETLAEQRDTVIRILCGNASFSMRMRPELVYLPISPANDDPRINSPEMADYYAIEKEILVRSIPFRLTAKFFDRNGRAIWERGAAIRPSEADRIRFDITPYAQKLDSCLCLYAVYDTVENRKPETLYQQAREWAANHRMVICGDIFGIRQISYADSETDVMHSLHEVYIPVEPCGEDDLRQS